MNTNSVSRRQFLKAAAGTALCTMPVKAGPSNNLSELNMIEINPEPTYELSPHLYMQFMEPLGTNDSSVEASWDHLRDRWRPELIEQTRSLSPGMIRWGGLFCSYYRWREAVGPRQSRIPMHNIVWGGIESNQIGTAEFVDFCRQAAADPLICVNFESDGRPNFFKAKGKDRRGYAQEAADWVAYCNQPDNKLRKSHGLHEPFNVRYWQIGNETSYSRLGFNLETTARKTVQFAKAMRQSDPGIKIIGWADSGWAPHMANVAGEHLNYLAFHHMFNPDNRKDPVLAGERYRKDNEATWQVLMEAWKLNDAKIRSIRDSVGDINIPLAMTECHFSIPGNNRNDVLRSWAAGVSYARILNNHQRHGDVLKIATAADFCGTRWNVNAIILGTHPNRTFLMPVAIVMRQYRKFMGKRAVAIENSPANLDTVASRTDKNIFLNIVNTNRTRKTSLKINIKGMDILSGQGLTIADNPEMEISSLNCRQVMQPQEISIDRNSQLHLPPASVTSLKLITA